MARTVYNVTELNCKRRPGPQARVGCSRVLGAALCLWGVAAVCYGAPGQSALPQLTAWLRPLLVTAQTGAAVVEVATGRTLFSRNADTALAPASTAKLYVAAAALALLGGDFRYETPVVTDDAYLGDGVLNGDLCVSGRGDPSWTEATLGQVVQRLAQLGVKRLTGSVVCDDSLFGPARTGADWGPANLRWHYAMEASAVCLNGNAVEVTVAPGSSLGSPPRVTVAPASGVLAISNTAKTVSPAERSTLSLDRQQGSRTLLVSGSLPRNASPVVQGMSVPQPALQAAYCLTHQLRKAGIAVAGEPHLGHTPSQTTLVLLVRSAPLRELVTSMAKHSDNHLTEQLLRTLGYRCQTEGTAAAGIRAIERFLSDHGIDFAACRLVDGCGLSRRDQVTARALTALLAGVWKLPCGRAFWEALPVAGTDGTLRGRMKDSPAAGAIHAKTGTLRGVCGLAGYAFPNGDNPLAFAFLANGYPGGAGRIRALQDGFCASLVADSTDLSPPSP